MLLTPTPLSPSGIVPALRAAGCVFAEDEAALLTSTARTPDELAAMVARRTAGHPLEHVLGWAEFAGLRVAVDEGVFVPRRRTEFLVAQAAALAPSGAVVVDLCCGTGALGAALAHAVGPVRLHAADLDPAAVRCARRNLAPLGGRVWEGDLYTALPERLRGRVDVLLANVPYVPTGDIPLLPAEARLHEAPLALDGGPDGLAVLRRVTAGAAEWLAPGGVLLFETSARQIPAAVRAVGTAPGGLTAQVVTCEETEANVFLATLSHSRAALCR